MHGTAATDISGMFILVLRLSVFDRLSDGRYHASLLLLLLSATELVQWLIACIIGVQGCGLFPNRDGEVFALSLHERIDCQPL